MKPGTASLQVARDIEKLYDNVRNIAILINNIQNIVYTSGTHNMSDSTANKLAMLYSTIRGNIDSISDTESISNDLMIAMALNDAHV